MQAHKNLAACRHLGNGGIIALIAVFKKRREKDLKKNKTVAVGCSLDIFLSVHGWNFAHAASAVWRLCVSGRLLATAVTQPLGCKLPPVAPRLTFPNKLSLLLHLLHVHALTDQTDFLRFSAGCLLPVSHSALYAQFYTQDRDCI